MKLPSTLSECHALIIRLDKELIELKVKNDERGLASFLIRAPQNFHKIDDVLEKVKGRPWTFAEISTEWLRLTELQDESKKTVSLLREHFKKLLTLNGFVHQTGGRGRNSLWRVNDGYNFVLRNKDRLTWRKMGQVEGTYLSPE